MPSINAIWKRFLHRGKRFFLMLLAGSAFAQEMPALRSHLVLDSVHQRVLAAENEHQRLPPASLTKLMTAHLIFEALERGDLKLEQKVPISPLARQQGGSRMFVEVNEQVSIDDLLRGLIIQSGNDASIALAEAHSGSVAAFVAQMNERARQLGMRNSHFMNPNGLPDEQHYSSAHDLALLSQSLIRRFPQHYHYYREKSFTYNTISQNNRNRLLWTRPGVDGLKTGHTQAAGYCLISSEARDDQRLIAVVLGAEKEAQRYQATEALLNQAWAQYQPMRILEKHQFLQKLPVYFGRKNEVAVYAAEALHLPLWQQDKDKVRAQLLFHHLEAPMRAGSIVGELSVRVDGQERARLPVMVLEDVEEAHALKRFWHGLKLWWRD